MSHLENCFLIKPDHETIERAALDLFVATLRDLAMAAKRREKEQFSGAPYHAPLRRLDETRAERSQILKYTPPAPELKIASSQGSSQ